MASGKKNYFRHSAAARKDPKLISLVFNYGKEAYFHYFVLIELCAEIALANDLRGDEEFTFNRKQLSRDLLVTERRLGDHLLAIQSSLLGHVVVTQNEVIIKFPNLPKYLGKYNLKNTSNSVKKRKENKNKEKNNIKSFESINNQESSLVKLFNDPEIISWLKAGEPKIQNKLGELYDAEYLKNSIEKAYFWQLENKKRKAGTFLSAWLERDKEAIMAGKIKRSEKILYDFFVESDCNPVSIK